MFGKKRAQPTDDQETQLPPDPDENEEDPGPPDQPAEPLSAGQFDQQGATWDDTYTAATDNPTHPLRHLKGV